MSKTFPRDFEEYCYNLRQYSHKRKVKQAARHSSPHSRMVKFARLPPKKVLDHRRRS